PPAQAAGRSAPGEAAMIATWMLYCIGIGLALTLAAYAAERALYLAGRPTRWAWSGALIGTLFLPIAATVRPQAFRVIPVPLADDVWPAVAGLWPPRVVIPAWALNLTQTQRRLMLAHEDEHVRARDPWLLAAGTAALVLAPWNLALWWLSQRLRLAVE